MKYRSRQKRFDEKKGAIERAIVNVGLVSPNTMGAGVLLQIFYEQLRASDDCHGSWGGASDRDDEAAV